MVLLQVSKLRIELSSLLPYIYNYNNEWNIGKNEGKRKEGRKEGRNRNIRRSIMSIFLSTSNYELVLKWM